jgi:glutamate racemase
MNSVASLKLRSRSELATIQGSRLKNLLIVLATLLLLMVVVACVAIAAQAIAEMQHLDLNVIEIRHPTLFL